MTSTEEFFTEESSGLSGTEFEGAPEATDPRRLLMVLLDTSGSMGPPPGTEVHRPYPIDQLNEALDVYLGGMQSTEFAYNGELAIGEFFERQRDNPMVNFLNLADESARSQKDMPFFYARHVRPLSVALEAGGLTPMGDAIGFSLELVASRIAALDDSDVEVNPRAVIVVLTDGVPTDPSALDAAAAELHQMEAAGDVVLWIGYTRDANPEAMRGLANKGNLIPLGQAPIASFMNLIDASLNVGGRSAEEIYQGLRNALGL